MTGSPASAGIDRSGDIEQLRERTGGSPASAGIDPGHDIVR